MIRVWSLVLAHPTPIHPRCVKTVNIEIGQDYVPVSLFPYAGWSSTWGSMEKSPQPPNHLGWYMGQLDNYLALCCFCDLH